MKAPSIIRRGLTERQARRFLIGALARFPRELFTEFVHRHVAAYFRDQTAGNIGFAAELWMVPAANPGRWDIIENSLPSYRLTHLENGR